MPLSVNRNAVSCNKLWSDTNGNSCLGNELRDGGQSRVPEPPESIIGIIFAGFFINVWRFEILSSETAQYLIYSSDEHERKSIVKKIHFDSTIIR